MRRRGVERTERDPGVRAHALVLVLVRRLGHHRRERRARGRVEARREALDAPQQQAPLRRVLRAQGLLPRVGRGCARAAAERLGHALRGQLALGAQARLAEQQRLHVVRRAAERELRLVGHARLFVLERAEHELPRLRAAERGQLAHRGAALLVVLRVQRALGRLEVARAGAPGDERDEREPVRQRPHGSRRS